MWGAILLFGVYSWPISTLFRAIIGLLSAHSSAEAADWPRFRGPNGDGKSTETGLLKEWPKGGPELLWSIKGLGDGFASAAVADGTIYTTGVIGKEKQGTLTAADLEGNILWQKTYGPGWTGSHPGSRTTPTVDSGNQGRRKHKHKETFHNTDLQFLLILYTFNRVHTTKKPFFTEKESNHPYIS